VVIALERRGDGWVRIGMEMGIGIGLGVGGRKGVACGEGIGEKGC
jgi:hypothetical protein